MKRIVSLIKEVFEKTVYYSQWEGSDEAMAGNYEMAQVQYKSRLYTGIISFFKQLILSLICLYRGHKWDVESNCGPESGSEDFYCSFCGESHHIQYY